VTGCEEPAFIIDPFPTAYAGVPIAGPDGSPSHVDSTRDSESRNVWAPFHSQCDWEVAHWAKMSGTTSSAADVLLASSGVCISCNLTYQSNQTLYQLVEKLGLSYRNVKGLNSIIDESLPPGCPMFTRSDLVIGDLQLEFYHRDIILCIRSLYGDPELVHDLVFAPERHYVDPTRTCRIFSEMHTGNWWWSVQVREELKFEPGGMLIVVLDIFGEAETRCNNNSCHSFLRQNTVDTVSGEGGISGVPDHRKCTKECPSEAIATCANTNRVHSRHAPRTCKESSCSSSCTGQLVS
jgi:hypothetical protein